MTATPQPAPESSGVLRPPRVRSGATVAVVCPAEPALARMPGRAAAGRRYLEERLGMRVRFMPYSVGDDGLASAQPERRAEDINAAFADDDVDVVLCALGGNNAVRVLPYLDFGVIAANPKVFQGYSDITTLHWAIYGRTGLSTFYGPMFVLSLAEAPAVLPYTDQAMCAAWFGEAPLRMRPARHWTEELLDLTRPEVDLSAEPRAWSGEGGWRALRPGRMTGPLVAGCLETLTWHVRGTSDLLDLAGCVLVLDLALPGNRWRGEELGGPVHVDAWLHSLARDGHLDRIAGLVVGRPRGYGPGARAELDQIILRQLRDCDVPIVVDFDIGHTDPMLTLPLGATATMDTAELVFGTATPPTTARNESER